MKAPQSTVGLLRRGNITRVKSDTHSHLTEIRCETSWCFLILSHPSSASCPRSSDALQNSSDMKATQQIKCFRSKANKSFKICSLPKFLPWQLGYVTQFLVTDYNSNLGKWWHTICFSHFQNGEWAGEGGQRGDHTNGGTIHWRWLASPQKRWVSTQEFPYMRVHMIFHT